MYKDKNKQREANRQAKAKQRAKDNEPAVARGYDDYGMTSEGMTVTPNVIPKPERTALGNIRVSKPGDDDYVPMCETTKAFIDNRDKQPSTAKRGKDIKTFNDLPPDVQDTINRLSESNEEKAKRTAAAIKYQHLFPDRFHSTGIAQTAEIGELR